MSISIHLLLAVALSISALMSVLLELNIRRRIKGFRRLQLFTICSAFLLVPSNIVIVARNVGETAPIWVVVASFSALGVQLALILLNWIPSQPTLAPRRVLAIGAHPDDLELACAGTLAKLSDAGHEIHALVASDGSVGGEGAIRKVEANRGAQFLNLTNIEIVGLPDTKVEDFESELVAAIEHKIKSVNPDLILTHSRHDQHQDHSAVHRATLRAGRRHPAILCYESPSVTDQFSPQVFVDIQEYSEVKAAAVSCHDDQMDKPYMSAKVIDGKAVFRGEQAKMGKAEAFEAVRVPAFEGVL